MTKPIFNELATEFAENVAMEGREFFRFNVAHSADLEALKKEGVEANLGGLWDKALELMFREYPNLVDTIGKNLGKYKTVKEFMMGDPSPFGR